MNKSRVIQVENNYSYRLFEKILKRKKHFMIHDEENQCDIGDIVTAIKTRPLSKKKNWILKQILIKYKVLY